MSPNREVIENLMNSKGWSASELARQMGVSRSEVHRFLHGQRDGGKKFIAGLMAAFPEEDFHRLFRFPCEKVRVMAKTDDTVDGGAKSMAEREFVPIRNLNDDLVAKVDFTNGVIEVIERHYPTYFLVPQGTNIVVWHEMPKPRVI